MVAALSLMRLGAWKTPAGLRGLAIAADNDRRTKRRAENCGTAKAEGVFKSQRLSREEKTICSTLRRMPLEAMAHARLRSPYCPGGEGQQRIKDDKRDGSA